MIVPAVIATIASVRRAGGGGGGSSDIPSANCLLLCHFDGADGFTGPFFDSSTFNRVVSASGNAQLTTTDPMFGNAALRLTGVNGSNTFAYFDGTAPEFNFSAGVFTIAGWVRRENVADTGTKFLYSARDGGSDRGPLIQSIGGAVLAGAWDNSGSAFGVIVNTTESIPVGAYQHLEFSGDGSTFYLFLAGILQQSISVSQLPGAPTGNVRIGADASTANREFNGRLDDWTVLNTCLHTANFTVPPGPYTLV